LKHHWLIFTSFLPPFRAGAGENAQNFAGFLRSINKEVRTISFTNYKPEETNHYDIRIRLRKKGVINNALFKISFIIKALPAIYKTNIVYIIGSFSNFLIVIFISWILNKKIIFSSTLLNADDVESLTSAGSYIKRKLRYNLLGKISLYIAINKEFEKRWIDKYKHHKTKILTTPQGVDIQKYSPLVAKNKLHVKSCLGISNKVPIILSVGNLTLRKGYDKIFRVLSSIKKDFIYIILGELDSSSKFYFWNKNNDITDHHMGGKKLLGDKILFMGYQNNPHYFYQIADIFLSFSQQEGLPNSFLEAMSSGVPIISRKMEGVDNWPLFDNAYFCEETNDFKRQIEKLLDSQAEREAIGVKSRMIAVESFSFERLYNKIIEGLY